MVSARFPEASLRPGPSAASGSTPESNAQEGEAFCIGSIQQAQIGTADLRIAAPAKPAQAFVGGSAQVAFPLKFAGSAATVPTFALSATTTAKGGKAKPTSNSFTPGAHQTIYPDHGKVTVSLPGDQARTYE